MSAWQSIGDVAAGMVEKLHAEKMDRARALRKNGVSYGRIVAATGLSMYALKCEFEPGYKTRMAVAVVQRRATVRKGATKRPASQFARYVGPTNHIALSTDAPAEVIADRDRRMAMQPHSLTAALMGDPPAPDWHKRA